MQRMSKADSHLEWLERSAFFEARREYADRITLSVLWEEEGAEEEEVGVSCRHSVSDSSAIAASTAALVSAQSLLLGATQFASTNAPSDALHTSRSIAASRQWD